MLLLNVPVSAASTARNEHCFFRRRAPFRPVHGRQQDAGANAQSGNGVVRRDIDIHAIAFTRNKRRAHDLADGMNVNWLPLREEALRCLGEVQMARRAFAEVDPGIIYQRGRSHLTHVAAGWAGEGDSRFVWVSNDEHSGGCWDMGKILPDGDDALIAKDELCKTFARDTFAFDDLINACVNAVTG